MVLTPEKINSTEQGLKGGNCIPDRRPNIATQIYPWNQVPNRAHHHNLLSSQKNYIYKYHD
jgi:hypothetical protein